jgi:hypothetical protein
LTPAPGRQDHTTSPSALAPFVKSASASTASRPAFVTIASRPSFWDGMARNKPVIWVRRQVRFLKIRNEGSGRFLVICPSASLGRQFDAAQDSRRLSHPLLHAGFVRREFIDR